MISIGNLASGGRAKTPLAAMVAARLRDRGERPAILSRGYGRPDPADGVVVVRDADGIRADLDRAGDEPLMLARQLDGVAVVVGASRYLAGRLAEQHLGATVHVLDDGFQHFDLRRNADLVVVGPQDLERPVTLPSGPLREPLDAGRAADAIIALDDVNRAGVAVIASGKAVVWRATRRLSPATTSDPVFAVAGIATPPVFFDGLRGAGWTIAGEMPFRDHHRYTPDDLARIAAAAAGAGARAIVTTEKDYVRLLPFRPFPMPIVTAALTISLDDAESFDAWLEGVLKDARA